MLTAVGPEHRGRRGSPDGGYPHPAPTASVRTQEGTSLVSEAAFDAALASKDPAAVQRAFDKFYEFRQRMEMEQEAAIRAYVAQTFQRLGVPAPTSDVPVDDNDFDMSIIKSYSTFLRQKRGLLGDLIRLHRGEDLFNRRPNKHLVVPAAEFRTKAAGLIL